MKIAFVLPTKNEEDSIGEILRDLLSLCDTQNWDGLIFLADDSTDQTGEIAKGFGVQLVDGGGVGLGQAMIYGLRAALQSNPDWIVTLDSDGQVDINEIPKFLETAITENADVVLSSRFLDKSTIDYRYPTLNWIGNRILVGILRLATGFHFTDSHGGIRLMNPLAAENLFLFGRHTYVQEFLIQLHRQGFQIIELSSRWKVRQFGGSRVLVSIVRYVRRTLPGLLFYLYAHWICFFLTLLAVGVSYFIDQPRYLPLAFVSLCFAWWIGDLPRRAIYVTPPEAAT